ncbi:hypothetical protein GCM10019995_17340 [Lactobacillus kefiranofaciens subsp. kefirgranum]|uniref:hypothetical protein n=1 Tax=Lactobacillus kefiranofaciens TaxID=267818 RepID=UPI0006D11452|nr:hypothetical protein [Lactobacillus kefiranofaciens]KRL28989.1 hypothetical protein FC94_GL000349 [Lactobacillus kefiranofaciens subsp. kefirgranum DSM 10550 = JCM 8572]
MKALMINKDKSLDYGVLGYEANTVVKTDSNFYLDDRKHVLGETFALIVKLPHNKGFNVWTKGQLSFANYKKFIDTWDILTTCAMEDAKQWNLN